MLCRGTGGGSILAATWGSLKVALGPFAGSVLLFCRLIHFHGLISVVCLHDIYLLYELRF